jgi:putative membrane protein
MNSIKPRSDDKIIDKTVDVTKYIFRSPNPNLSLFIFFLISIFLGFILTLDLKNLYINFELDKLSTSLIGYGLIIIGIPTILTALISNPIINGLGGRFYYRRSVLLVSVSILLLGLVITICKLVTIFYKLEPVVILVFGYSSIIVLRHSALVATSHHSHSRSLPGAIIHPLTGFLMIILVFLIGTRFDFGYLFIPDLQLGGIEIISMMIGFILVFIVTTLLWISIVAAPFKKNYNVDGLELAVHALGQFTDQNEEDNIGLERFFSSFGTPMDVPADVIYIQSKTQRKKVKKFKTILIVPGVHPGPFGYAGGSNLPNKLAQKLKIYSDNILVFHGSSTHDYNPAESGEVQKIVSGLEKILKSETLKFNRTGSDFVRVSSKDSVQICAQVIGRGVILAYTSSPDPTDDLDFEIGEKAVKKAVSKLKPVNTAMFIDAHNCLEKGVATITSGSKKAIEIQKLVEKAISDINKVTVQSGIRIGVAKSTQFSTKEGFGPLGIQVMIVETGMKKVAYILIDGNNMMPGLREHIREKIGKLVDEAEIFTSDNHVVNITMGGYNPIGLKSSSTKIITTIGHLVNKAINDLEDVEVGAERVLVKNIKIFGKGNTVKLSRTINKTISRMGKSLVCCNVLAIIGCILIYCVVV